MMKNAHHGTGGAAKGGRPTGLKRVLKRLGAGLLAILGLLIGARMIAVGLQWGNILQVAGGFVAMGACVAWLAVLVVPALRAPSRVWIPVVGGLVIATGLAVYLTVATRVEVSAACGGQGVAAAATYGQHPGRHPVEVLYSGRRVLGPLPEGWQPASTGDAELVACVGRLERYIIETCGYTGGPDVTRYGYRRVVTLVAARTGEALASEAFRGEPPRACGQTEERSARSLKGEKQIDRKEVWAWLDGYVTGAPEADAEVPAAPASKPPAVPATAPAAPATEALSPAQDIRPEPTSIEVQAPGEPPQIVVTPGKQPPETAVLTGSPSLWSGPEHQGEHMGIILKQGETVEILATSESWTQVRWVSPDGEEVIGWALSEFLTRQ